MWQITLVMHTAHYDPSISLAFVASVTFSCGSISIGLNGMNSCALPLALLRVPVSSNSSVPSLSLSLTLPLSPPIFIESFVPPTRRGWDSEKIGAVERARKPAHVFSDRQCGRRGIMTGVEAGRKEGRKEGRRGVGRREAFSCDMRLRLGIPEAAAHCVATIHQKRTERGGESRSS